MESSKYGEYEKSQNMINVPLARKKSMLKDGCNNAPRTGPNASHEEDETQNSNLNMCPASVQVMILKRMIGNQLPNELKKEPEYDAQSVTQDEPKLEL